jgi:hypothetical protein
VGVQDPHAMRFHRISIVLVHRAARAYLQRVPARGERRATGLASHEDAQRLHRCDTVEETKVYSGVCKRVQMKSP